MNSNKKERLAWEKQQLSRAIKFTACMFIGQGFDVREASSLEEARILKRTMMDEYANLNYGRGVMIYAITKGDNLTIFVE
jgi:hypothetical protein